MNNRRSSNPLPLHGGQLDHVAARYGLDAAALVDFSANINPDGPPASVWSAIQLALTNVRTLTMYPDLELTKLKTAIAQSCGISAATVVVANGFVPLLEAALRSQPLQRCLLPVPSFSEYRRTLENASVAVVPYGLRSEDDFRYQPDEMLNALLAEGCDSMLLANPQNPSGVVCELEKMIHLIKAAGEQSVTVFLDEAFVDYSSNSLVHQAALHEHLIVFRSLTKFFAVPGLRVAYAVCVPSRVQKLNRFISPWPVTTLASEAVRAALDYELYAEQSRLGNQRRRSWLERELAHLKITTYPSAANFILLRFPSHVDVSVVWEKMMTEHQIVLRSCDNFEKLGPGYLRIAVLSEQANERLIAGLKKILE